MKPLHERYLAITHTKVHQLLPIRVTWTELFYRMWHKSRASGFRRYHKIPQLGWAKSSSTPV